MESPIGFEHIRLGWKEPYFYLSHNQKHRSDNIPVQNFT